LLSVSEVSIERFKRASQITFPVGDVNVIVGGNNSGKSSSIQGLHFFFTLLQSIELAGKWNKTLRTTLAPEELIYSPANDPYRLYEEGYLQQQKFINFSVTLSDGRKVEADVTKGKNANLSAIAQPVEIAKELSSLTQPFSVYSPGLAGIARQEVYVSDGVLLRAVSRGDANLFLRNIIHRLSEHDNWEKFSDDLRELFGDVVLDVYFETDSDEFIIVEAVFDDDREVPLESCGTGLLQAIQILTYVHYFRPSLVILDEPDSHLHPNNQRLLCDLIVKIASDYGCRVILTTHSRHVLDALDGRAQFIWIQNGNAAPATPDDHLDILMDLGALDIREVAQNDLKFFVLTEDKDKTHIKDIILSSNFDDNDFGIFSYFGVTEPHKLRILTQFIRDMRPTATIIVHRDRDFMTDAEVKAWEERVRELKLQPLVTAGTDIEDALVNASYLSEKNSNLTELEAAELISSALEELKVDAVKNYVNGRIEALRRSGDTNPNYGAIAEEATQMLTSAPRKTIKGKQLLARTRAKFRAQKGVNLKTSGPSTHLSSNSLIDIRKLQK
jgi:predicted ATPase